MELEEQRRPGRKLTNPIDELFAEASARMCRITGIQDINSLPIVFLLGDFGSEAAGCLLHSGLKPEMVAGKRGAGIWYGRQTLFVELSISPGGLASEAALRHRLFRMLRPVERLNAVLVSKNPPTRSAVVEVDCDLFLQAGEDAERSERASRYRDILEELTRELGFQLPVYVLFSRADRISYFGDFAGRLSDEEAAEVLGVSLAFSAAAGEHVTHAFEAISYSLADQRPEPLGREREAANLAKVYEFPREFAKLRPLVVAFLADLCRVSDSGVHPFLRGFYFAGERQQEPDSPWVFLERLFPGVFLADRVTSVAAQGYVKANWGQRLTLAAVTVLSLLLAGWWAVSFRENSKLVSDASSELRATKGEGSLEELAAMQKTLVRLTAYEVDGEPLRYGAFLYRGSDVQAVLQLHYLASFRRILLEPSLEAIVYECRHAADYEQVYNALRAYLMLSRFPEKVDAEFLTKQLVLHWPGTQRASAAQQRMALDNFALYVSRYAKPEAMDARAVESARAYLLKFREKSKEKSAARPQAESWVLVGEAAAAKRF